MTIALAGIPTELVNMLQDRTLERVFHDALLGRLLYRSEALAELWQANLGERVVQTRVGLLPVKTKPLVPGQDPTPSSFAIEQWVAEARQYGDTIDTHMPTNYVTLAPIFLRNTVNLGIGAGETMNRLARNRVFRAYLGGTTNLTAAALAGATQIDVASINGFTEVLLNGTPTPVGAGAPLAGFVGAEAVNFIGALPLNADDPFGPGRLFLAVALVGAPAIRTVVTAANRSTIVRAGGGTSCEALTSANIITMQDIINAVSKLRGRKVPPCPDGFYHLHLSTEGEAQIFADPVFQRLNQSLPDGAAYRDFAIGQLLGCRIYRETENPDTSNSGTLVASGNNAQASGEIGGDVVNGTGVPVRRAMLLGGGAIYEKYLDESKFITEAGVQGKIGTFNVVNNGVQVMTQRVRFIMRSPQDRLQQVVAQTWSWSGDFTCPTDQLTTDPARHKRAIVIEHA